jgi:hypothetical protein
METPTIVPNKNLTGDEREIALEIYRQKYANFRHFDTLRWQVPGVVIALYAIILNFAGDKGGPTVAFLFFLFGLFALSCWWLLVRLRYNTSINTKALQEVARLLGDDTVPPIPAKYKSAAFWFICVTALTGAGSLVISIIMLIQIYL